MISAAGSHVVASCEDGAVRIWRCATRQQVDEWHEATRDGLAFVDARQRQSRHEDARRRSARSTDVGAIKLWLIAAPASTTWAERSTISSGARLSPDSPALPRAGDALDIGDRRLIWRSLTLDDDHLDLDLDRVVGEIDDRSAVLLCYIWSDRARSNLTLAIGSDDQARVLLNGAEVYRRALPRPYLRDHDLVRDGITLRAGRNVVVFEVFNEAGEWEASLRIADAGGRSLDGIRVSTDPDAPDGRANGSDLGPVRK